MKKILTILIVFLTTISYGQLEKTYKSAKWDYILYYPNEYAKSSFTAADNSMTELHLADGHGRSIIVMSQPFSNADVIDLDKLTKEEMQEMLRRTYPKGVVSKFYKTTIGGRKGIISYFDYYNGKIAVQTIQGSIYNGQCLIQVISTSFKDTFQSEENSLLKMINSIRFN